MITKTDPELVAQYTEDASDCKGNAEIVYIPESPKDISEIAELCTSKRMPLMPSGARTGLAGGCVPVQGAVISTERLNKIIDIDTSRKIATVQPGVLRHELETALNDLGYFLPPNPTEKNSSVGGNAATNASGARTFKYGAVRHWIDNLSVTLINGDRLNLSRQYDPFFSPPQSIGDKGGYSDFSIINSNRGKSYNAAFTNLNVPPMKHAAGYYLTGQSQPIDLFIGSEGTLGIINEIQYKFIESPEKVFGAIIFFDDEEKLMDFVEVVREQSKINNKLDYRKLNELSARTLEFFDRYSLNMLREQYTQIPQAAGAIWIEQEITEANEDIILEKWSKLIESHTKLTDDTWIAFSAVEHERFREFRHHLPLQVNEMVAQSHIFKITTDTAVPDYKFLRRLLDETKLDNAAFGHIGNSHLHFHIFVDPVKDMERSVKFYDACVTEALRLGGTISAEHGVGKIKKKYLHQMFGEKGINEMKRIKSVFDPSNLLGIGTLFD
jgi:D-lactate dehydrogenase (cytochrome)